MITDIVTALISGFSDVIGRYLGRYRYLSVLAGGYTIGFCIFLPMTVYFFFQLDRFRWDALFFGTALLGSILGFGGVFIAFVNRPKSPGALGVSAERVDAKKPKPPGKAASRFNSSNWDATSEARTTLVVKPGDIANDPIFKQLTNREVPVIVVQKSSVKKTEDQLGSDSS
jgi:hypothetical protein